MQVGTKIVSPTWKTADFWDTSCGYSSVMVRVRIRIGKVVVVKLDKLSLQAKNISLCNSSKRHLSKFVCVCVRVYVCELHTGPYPPD